MAVPRIAAVLGAAVLAVLVSLPAQAGGASLIVRFGGDPSHRHHHHNGHMSRHVHPHHHRHLPLERESLHPHADNHHRLHYGHLHPTPRVVITHPPQHVRRVVIVPAVTFVPRPPVVHYVAPVAYAAAPAYAAVAHGPRVLDVPAFAVDGDTFDAGGVRYRLAGIDAPELHEPNGYNARARLQQLLAMGQVTLIPVGTDPYGRILVHVLVGAWNVAGVLRAEGYAR